MPERNRELMETCSRVERAPNREQVLRLLSGDTVYTPTEIADESGIILQNISRINRALTKMGLVNCLNPEANQYKYYEITDKGEKVVKLLDRR